MTGVRYEVDSAPTRAFEERLRDAARQMKATARELEAIASRAARLTRRMVSLEEIRSNAPALAALAQREYEQRRLREAMIPTDQFGDPAWDMMLDLFVRDLLGKTTLTTSAQLASQCPPTTALRYMVQLEEEGMLVREPSATDGCS